MSEPKWLSVPGDCAVPVIVKSFTLHKPTAAEIKITGLGFFRLTVNGRRVTDDLFTPALTDYLPRDMSHWNYPLFDTMTHRIRYMRYDIGAYLCDGKNELEITLAPGWFRQEERIAEGHMSFGKDLLTWFSACIETADGTITVESDGSETYRASAFTYSNLFVGETIDARFDAAKAPVNPVAVIPAPDAIFEEQTCLPDRVIRSIKPFVLKCDGDRTVYDCGENISGVARVTAGGPAGRQIVLRFAEEKTADNEPDFLSTGADYTCISGIPQIQRDIFITADTTAEFRPEFVWHAFRYIEVQGSIDDITVDVIHTQVPVTSSFSSSSEGLNFLYDAYIRTQQDNLHNCIPSDCPHRERLGYTGDGQVAAPAATLLLDAEGVYRKWLTDIYDCQDIAGGHVQHAAPLMGGGGGPGGWGGAMVVVPYVFYKRYGDVSVLREAYPHMQAWIGYLERHCENGLVTSEEKGGWCLGDWAALEKMVLPEPYVNSCCLVDEYNKMAEMATCLRLFDDAKSYRAKAENVKKAIVSAYYNEKTGSFCDGVQGADAYALWVNIAQDDRTKTNLVNRYTAMGHFDTGFIGTAILCDVLADAGEVDLLYTLLCSEDCGSYLYMKRAGATTVWEHWDGASSHNHPMFGAPARHLLATFLGITQPADCVAYNHLVIAPKVPKKLSSAQGDVTLQDGKVSVSMAQGNGQIVFSVTVPVTVTFRYAGTEQTLAPGRHTISFAQ